MLSADCASDLPSQSLTAGGAMRSNAAHIGSLYRVWHADAAPRRAGCGVISSSSNRSSDMCDSSAADDGVGVVRVDDDDAVDDADAVGSDSLGGCVDVDMLSYTACGFNHCDSLPVSTGCEVVAPMFVIDNEMHDTMRCDAER